MSNRNYYARNAQSTLEYAMVVACIVAALITMQIYVKRGIQGRVKGAADQIGEQYSAEKTTSSLTQTITNPLYDSNIVTTTPVFINVTNPDTGLTEKREVTEVTRHEATVISTGENSYEKTGNLSEENLFTTNNQ